MRKINGTAANALLTALGPDAAALIARAERVHVHSGDVISAAGTAIDHVYFPVTTVLSLQSRTGKDSWCQTGVIGFEGIAPVAPIYGSDWSDERVVALVPGDALRVSREEFLQLTSINGLLSLLLNRFLQSFFTYVSQCSACHRKHRISQRSARFLLVLQDRLATDEFPLIHSFLADALGVKRSGVTLAAEALRASGAIDYVRGTVRIVDRERLETLACPCYPILRRALERLLPVRVADHASHMLLALPDDGPTHMTRASMASPAPESPRQGLVS